MPTSIERAAPVKPQAVLFAANVADSDTICTANYAAFAVVCAPGTVSTTIVWHAATINDGPYYPVILPNGTQASTTVVAGQVYIAPPELYACTFIRGVAPTPFSALVMLKT